MRTFNYHTGNSSCIIGHITNVGTVKYRERVYKSRTSDRVRSKLNRLASLLDFYSRHYCFV